MDGRVELRIDTEVPGVCTLVVVGEVDGLATSQLRQALATPSVRRVDMAAVTFLDSGGLHALIDAHRARAAGSTFAIVHASATVRRLLDLVGLTWLLDDTSKDLSPNRRTCAKKGSCHER